MLAGVKLERGLLAGRAGINLLRHCSILAHLLDDSEALGLLGHLFGCWDEVRLTRSDEEGTRPAAHRLVLLPAQADLLEAAVVPALADEALRLDFDAGHTVGLQHALVNLAEEGLVLPGAALAVASDACLAHAELCSHRVEKVLAPGNHRWGSTVQPRLPLSSVSASRNRVRAAQAS